MPERLLAHHGGAALRAHVAAAATITPADDPTLPPYVANFLVNLRLGVGVPFSYLVPDQAMLPSGSIRFFTVDEGWFDSLVDGALAVGTASSRDTEHLAAVRPAVHAAVRVTVPLAAQVRRRRATRQHVADHVAHHVRTGEVAADDSSTAPSVTGLLMRSSLVSDWPGFALRAFTTTDIDQQADPSTVPEDLWVPILRMELLSPSVLLVLFSGTPALVWIEEPHHGIQLGVDEVGGIDVITPVSDDGTEKPGATPIPVPLRPGGLRVVDVAALASSLNVSSSAELATQLLRPPYRQRFEAGQ